MCVCVVPLSTHLSWVSVGSHHRWQVWRLLRLGHKVAQRLLRRRRGGRAAGASCLGRRRGGVERRHQVCVLARG